MKHLNDILKVNENFGGTNWKVASASEPYSQEYLIPDGEFMIIAYEFNEIVLADKSDIKSMEEDGLDKNDIKKILSLKPSESYSPDGIYVYVRLK